MVMIVTIDVDVSLPSDLLGRVPVIVVGFRNPHDVLTCVAALEHVNAETPIEVFICENGGKTAFEQLIAALTSQSGPCLFQGKLAGQPLASVTNAVMLQGKSFRVFVACAQENLGYAGGANAWLRPLLEVTGWTGAWILNPDT